MPSLQETFGTSDGEAVARELRQRYISNADEEGRQRAALERRQLFQTNGLSLLNGMIEKLIGDPKTQQKYKDAAKYAKFDYALTRIVKTLGTVYNKPAVRSVAGANNNKIYNKLLKDTRHDEVMREFNYAMLTHNDVYLSFRVRNADKERVTEFVTPERFWAIAHPDDSTYLVGVMLDQKQPGADESKRRYLVWTDTEVAWLSGKKEWLGAETHTFGRIPGLLCHLKPVQGALLDPYTGQQRIDATMSALFEQVLLVKESKSVTAQLLLSGDLSTTASGQAQDTEVDVITGEGVGAQRVERGVGLEQFRDTKTHIVESCAAHDGIGPDLLHHSGATSGYEMDLRRIPMEEVRNQQISVFRPIERDFAELQASILEREVPGDQQFKVDSWKIDFAEVTRHMTPKEVYEVRKLKRSSGHSNVFAEAMEDNPDLDPKGAVKFVLNNQDAQAVFVKNQRALNMPADADADNPGRSPEDNGADNQAPAEGGESEPVLQ